MASIVVGLGVSHGPMLSIPAQYWEDRAKADRANPKHFFRGSTYTFPELAALRAAGNYAEQSTLEVCRARAERCQAAITQLGDILIESRADLAVIVGNDQMEVFTADHVPAFAIFWGPYVEGIPRDEAFLAKLPPGVARAELDRTPASYTQYPCHPQLGEYLIQRTMRNGFDPAQIHKLTTGEIGSNAAPHAYGFVYRRVMRDAVLPHVPVFVNTFYPPNQPSCRRCYEFGRSLGRALREWNPNQAAGGSSSGDTRIAVIASGGLSHFVVDEEFDREVLGYFERGDVEALCSLPEDYMQSGTSEIKNWITAAGILSESGLRPQVLDYLPCYRSEAGTGSGLGFAAWR